MTVVKFAETVNFSYTNVDMQLHIVVSRAEIYILDLTVWNLSLVVVTESVLLSVLVSVEMSLNCSHCVRVCCFMFYYLHASCA